MNNEAYITMFNNYGFLGTKFSEDQLKPIKDEIHDILSKKIDPVKYNSHLAGNLENEYQLKQCHQAVSQLMIPYVKQYDETFHYIKVVMDQFNITECDIELYSLWVNFQKKHEFNPSHLHSGLMSFVIWIDIPFTNEDEKNLLMSRNSRCPCPGNFFFSYVDALGHIQYHQIPADKEYNNRALIFPSTMHHGVYPFFTSDSYRITVSGNFGFKKSTGLF